MTTQVTQCPNCNTSFRVTDAQLGIANGAVRCGSCLNIFQAQEYWLDQQQKAAASQPSQSTSSTTNTELDFDDDIIIDEADEFNSLDSIFEDGDFDDDNYLDQLSDQLLGNELDKDSVDDTKHEPSPEPVKNNSEDEPVEFDDILIDDDDPIIDDNLLIGDTKAQSIINIEDDLQELEHTETEEDNDGEFSSFFLDLDEKDSKPATVYKELDDIGDEDTDEDTESWAKQLLADAENEDDDTASSENHRPEHSASSKHIDNEFDDLEHNEDHQEQLDPELLDILNDNDDQLSEVQEEEYILGDTPLLAGERIGEDKQALLANIEPEPVELATSSNTNIWLKRSLLTGVIAALLLLAVQYLSFNFERLARDANYRPILSKSCSIIGCTLPELYDVSLVRSSNLMVRSHADIPKALIVDAIITNLADFKQPFPIMELQFKSLSGDIVAGRRFQPTEYLAGELLGRQTMPIKQPIHIALEIIDPGESAVNYQMIFHAANR